jgi:hypothetical protein
MPEAADAVDRHGVAAVRAAVIEGAEGGGARAQQRRRVHRRELVRDTHQGRRARDHVLGVAAVDREAGDAGIGAALIVALGARLAGHAMTTAPADAHAASHVPTADAGASFGDRAYHLVSGDARIREARVAAVHRDGVAVADPAGLDFDEDLPLTGLRDLRLNHHEIGTGAGYLNRVHQGHG